MGIDEAPGALAQVEPFTPPPPIPGCASSCLVCHPVAASDDVTARFERQSRSPFVRYRIMKDMGDGSKRPLNEAELQQLERSYPDLCEWCKAPQSTDLRWKKICMEILQRLFQKREAANFSYPVNPALVPDYPTIIKHPMDLKTVKKKLADGQLHTPDDFIALVRLVFRNAYVYNPIGDPYHNQASMLSTVFETELQKLWGELQA